MVERPFEPPLGARLLTGFGWNVAGAVIGKAISLSANVAVLWYLSAEEVGVATWALSSTSLIAINGGMVVQALVQSGAQFAQRESDAFWLNVILSFVGAIAILLAAPAVAHAYATPQLVPLMSVIAAARVVTLLLPNVIAYVQAHSRFGQLALISLVSTVGDSAALVVLAVLGAGAYAKVAPMFIHAVFVTIVVGWWGLLRPIKRPNRAGIVALARPTGWLAIVGALQSFRANGMHLVLGMLRDAAGTGVFFSGYALSLQAVFLLGENLNRVLFPTLVTLGEDPQRRDRALVKLTRLMTLVLSVACVVQAFVSEYLVQLFPDRWADCAPVMFWLSLGLTTHALAIVAESNFLAQRRNREAAIWKGLQALSGMTGLATGALLGDGMVAIAIGAAIGLSVGNTAVFVYSLWHQGVADRGLLVFLGRAAPVTGAMCVAGALGAELLRGNDPWFALFAQAGQLAVVALLSARLFAASDLRELLQRLRLGPVSRWLRLD